MPVATLSNPDPVLGTLKVVRWQWKVLQCYALKSSPPGVREGQPAPAPFHVLPRGLAGPGRLAIVLFEK